MIGALRSLIGMGDEELESKKEYAALTADFEHTISADFPSRNNVAHTVTTAKKIRELICKPELALQREDKLRLLKMFNRAKVRALLSNEEYAYALFSSLDSISADVARKI
jgi:hypothetical protein